MNNFIYALIILFGGASYVLGIIQMFKGKYSPSTFTRVIWVFLAVNSFAGLVLTTSSKSALALGIVFLLGNIAMCIASFWKGVRTMGKLEYFCILLLIISAIIWLLFDAPLVNLIISLFAHFVGGLPTYKKVLKNPKSESFGFWSLFFIASLLSVFTTNLNSVSGILFPLYFVIFDGTMMLLTLRKSNNTQ